MNIYDIAKTCHQVNKAYCESIGDFSQKNWEETPVSIIESVVAGVKFYMDNPRATPEDSHQNWFDYKAAEGYVYGEVKDTEKKTHPCMVSFDELPADHQAKDYLFSAVVRSLIPVMNNENVLKGLALAAIVQTATQVLQADE